MKLKHIFSVKEWTWQFYAIVGVALLSLNLFGPKGIVHWVLLNQEESRILARTEGLAKQLHDTKIEVLKFQKSSFAKERAIREHLGYLKSNEISIEILPANEAESF